MTVTASHCVTRCILWKKLIIFLLVSRFVSTTGIVTQCYRCKDDIILETDFDFKDTCTDTGHCSAKPPKDSTAVDAQNRPIVHNEVCSYSMIEGKGELGTVRIKRYFCSTDFFKKFSDVGADGCRTEEDMVRINEFIRGSVPAEKYPLKYLEFCSCPTDLCNNYVSKVSGLPEPKGRSGGAMSTLVFGFYLLSLLLPFLL